MLNDAWRLREGEESSGEDQGSSGDRKHLEVEEAQKGLSENEQAKDNMGEAGGNREGGNSSRETEQGGRRLEQGRIN